MWFQLAHDPIFQASSFRSKNRGPLDPWPCRRKGEVGVRHRPERSREDLPMRSRLLERESCCRQPSQRLVPVKYSKTTSLHVPDETHIADTAIDFTVGDRLLDLRGGYVILVR